MIQSKFPCTIAIEAIGGYLQSDLELIAEQAGFRVCVESPQYYSVATDDYLRPELGEINARLLRLGKPWLLFKAVGAEYWIGPVFSSRTGCWECLANRLRLNRHIEGMIESRNGQPHPLTVPKTEFPPSVRLGISLAMKSFVGWVESPDNSPIDQHVVSINLDKQETRKHFLVKRPQCKVCGVGQVPRTPRIEIRSRKKLFTVDGGHRTASPEDTFQRLKHHISPITGVVGTFEFAKQTSALTPTYIGCRPFVLKSREIMFQSNYVWSFGKGASPEQSRTSGLCEALERYSALCNGEEHEVRASYLELDGQAIKPNDVMGFSQKQLDQGEGPKRQLCDDECVSWTPAWSLTGDCIRYLPSAICYFAHPDHGNSWCFSDSNGLASGNTIEEAILQGFFELVERDSTALWWYNRAKLPKVNLESFDLPYIQKISEYYDSLGRDLWCLDMTSDLNIPAIACITRSRSEPDSIMMGFGCHFDPKIAALRSVTEANQCLVLSNGEYRGKIPYDPCILANAEPVRSFSDFSTSMSLDLKDDVLRSVELCQRNGMEMIVVDQTRDDYDLSVARVVIPQLNHYYRRLGKQRLYTIPAKLGWIDTILKEEDLQQHPLCI